MMGKAENNVDKELDIVKFIRRQRFSQFALLSLLSGRQTYIVDKISEMVIRESSDLDDATESDLELD